MAEMVNPNEARKGDFLVSFDMDQKAAMMAFIKNMEQAIKKHKNTVGAKRVVYTVVTSARGGKTYQVFLVDKK